MLDRLASGGLTSVILIALLALGYARVLDAPRRVYIGIGLGVLLAIIGSQFLPAGNIFRTSIADSFAFMGRAIIWISPILAYALVIRWVRKKTRDREENDET